MRQDEGVQSETGEVMAHGVKENEGIGVSERALRPIHPGSLAWSAHCAYSSTPLLVMGGAALVKPRGTARRGVAHGTVVSSRCYGGPDKPHQQITQWLVVWRSLHSSLETQPKHQVLSFIV